jgi:hypothetical protein
MKINKIALLAGVLVVAAIISPAFINSKKKSETQLNDGKGFAVVELFTSEGCSSCPPADAVVAKLQKESAGKPIYILAYHVDYWNHLGWKDVFSDPDYSKRQRDYAKTLNISSVYTPQIVVNGKTELVGSEEEVLHNVIKSALQKDAPAQLALVNMQISRNTVQVNYNAKGNGNHSVLLLALIQKSAQSQVKAGENSGRMLAHIQIVQKLKTITLTDNKAGFEKINLPNNFTPQNWEVIGFIQNTTTGEIFAAAKAAFLPNQMKNAE